MKSKINKEIVYLAIPNIISNISVPLLSSVDTSLMGRLTPAHLGAVGISSMLFNLIYWNFGFLRMGVTGMTAQAYGREDKQDQVAIMSRAIVLALLIATSILLVNGVLYSLGSDLLKVLPEQQTLVGEYFSIRILEAPATLLLYVFFGWFFGMQNTIAPMIITIIINVTNIAISYIAVAKLGMEIEGVAYGTVIAQYVGLLLCVVIAWRRYPEHFKSISLKYLYPFSSLLHFMHVNASLFIRTICLTGAFGFFYAKSSTAGALVLASNVVLQQFINWMSYAVDGFAYASESLTGKYFGQEDRDSLHSTVTFSMLWGFGLSVLFSIAFYFGGIPIAKLFTQDAEVLTTMSEYLIWVGLIPVIAFASYIWDGVYIGLTATVSLMISMLLSVVVYIGSYYSLLSFMSPNHALWGSLLLFLLSRGVLQTIAYIVKGADLK